MRNVAVVSLFGLVMLTACGHLDRSVSKGEIKQEWGALDDKDFVRTRGIGAAPAATESTTQARGMARNAALVAARYEMLGRLKGLKIEGGLTVAQLMQTDASITEKADALIKSAEEVQTEWTSDGGAVVVIQVRRSDAERLTRR